MGTIIGVLALLIASLQLHLQRVELKKGNELEESSNELDKLKATLDAIKSEIEFREKIISDEKAKSKADWDKIKKIACVINKKLRPAQREIQQKIIRLYGGEYSDIIDLTKNSKQPQQLDNQVLQKAA
ncbi:hypothetical protein [Parashewanella tropica]|uniref:hypothetical protein n=1 Tax=Parashewanella tropica TaxID=2547970 RepID=UPI00105AA254|nr:hypothetical protein [Parashewanella tropica]